MTFGKLASEVFKENNQRIVGRDIPFTLFLFIVHIASFIAWLMVDTAQMPFVHRFLISVSLGFSLGTTAAILWDKITSYYMGRKIQRFLEKETAPTKEVIDK